MKRKIGVPQSGYNVARNIPEVDGYERTRPWDMHRVLTAVSYRLHGELPPHHQFSFRPPYFPKVDLFHFFNSVSSTSTPWFTTYEDIIPRWGKRRTPDGAKKGIELILGDACKGIIAFSNATERVLESFFKQQGYGFEWNQIAHKRNVLYPPQPLLPIQDRRTGPIQFCFVGGDFYRKGGAEVVAAFHRLYARGQCNWSLTLVGNLSSWGDYASNTHAEDEAKTRSLLQELGPHASHVDRLPNAAVLNLLGQSHYLLFPTYQDTFGYIVLEAMASGCVPIASSTRVFPEIIEHNVNGILIDVPTDEAGDAHRTGTSLSEKLALIGRIEETIEAVLNDTTETWIARSRQARQWIASAHDPAEHRNALHKLYKEI